jgi:hypothetical protein
VGWAVCEGGGVVWRIRYRKNEKKTHTLFSFCFQVSWVRFSMVVASVDLPGAVGVVHLAREHPCKSY